MLFFILIATVLFVAVGVLLGVNHRLSDKVGSLEREVGHLEVRLKAKEDDTPRCLCGHGVNFHGDGGGKCEQTTGYETLPIFSSIERQVICRCKRYTGPEPLPTYYHPELGVS